MRAFFLTVLFSVVFATQSYAGLIGTTITASSFKLYQSEIGYTPYTVVIDNSVEMGWSFSNQSAFAIHTADFADTTLTMSWSMYASGFISTESTFTNSAFAGLSASVLSTTVPGGLGGLSLIGDKLTVFAANLYGPSATYTAVIQFTGFSPPAPTVPEPSSIAIMGMGCLWLGWRQRVASRKRT